MAKDKTTTPVVEETAGVNTVQNLSAEQIAKATADKASADKAAADKAEADKAEADKAAADKAAADKAAADKAAADKAEADKAEADKAAADKAAAEEVHEAQLIPSGIFVAENGDSFEFAVDQFTFQGKVYTKEEALSDHTDVLEHLISVKSFILKKV
ncbi:hypothetical protein QLS91_08040 [Flavobacterium sp. LB2P84]|uniref:hypothetical protein n=1 Tax=Flavobacterium yafengii TaxID=3041253 RepID=UPI0024A7DAF0|nr:hypothetical protein [Flavobacterium yafengii]MDI6033022.1 hypothetical protein [Flavobacterium yafengii]